MILSNPTTDAFDQEKVDFINKIGRPCRKTWWNVVDHNGVAVDFGIPKNPNIEWFTLTMDCPKRRG